MEAIGNEREHQARHSFDVICIPRESTPSHLLLLEFAWGLHGDGLIVEVHVDFNALNDDNPMC
eukprot:3121647-Amphidinium_carterae.1